MPHREGVTGMAANFVLHVNDLINGRKKLYRVPIQARALAAAS